MYSPTINRSIEEYINIVIPPRGHAQEWFFDVDIGSNSGAAA
jgi:hypothetical protein